MTVKDNAQQIDDFINHLLLMTENQRELLLGSQSDAPITLTQGHLLMLLWQKGDQTNGALAQALNVSPAAVTKAMRGLQQVPEPLVQAQPDAHDGRINRWTLTQLGRHLAREHAIEHDETQVQYQRLLSAFDTQEQAVISRFLTALSTTVAGGQHAK